MKLYDSSYCTLSIMKLKASRIVIVRGLKGMRCRRILSIIVSSGSYALAKYSKTDCEVINSIYLFFRIKKFFTLLFYLLVINSYPFSVIS